MWPWLSSLNALLFSKMSVLSPASTLSHLLLHFTYLAGSSCQPSDLCLLPFTLLFLSFCTVTAAAFSCIPSAPSIKTFPLASILVPCLNVPYPHTPLAPGLLEVFIILPYPLPLQRNTSLSWG